MLLFCRVRQKDLKNLSADEIKVIIPYLFYHKIDVSKIVPVDAATMSVAPLPEILQLQTLENLCAHTSELDFNGILNDARKEIKSRDESKQQMDKPRVCYIVPSPATHICLDFENTFGFEKNARYVLAEILAIQHHVQESKGRVQVPSELFGCSIYFHHILVILCVLVSEIPAVVSLPEVIYSLIFLSEKLGTLYMKAMLCNFPHQWDAVVRCFISKARSKDEETLPNLRIREALKELIAVNNDEYVIVLDYCISQMRLPSLVTYLTLRQLGNGWNEYSIIHLLKRVLLDEGEECRKWFSGYLMDLHNQPENAATLHASLANLGEALIVTGNEEEELAIKEQRVDNGMIFLRVMAALRSFADYMFDSNECSVILRLITQDVVVSLRGVEFVNLSLAFIICLYGSLGNAVDLDATLVRWLQKLLEMQERFHVATGTSYGDLLLLVAICFYRHTQLHPSIIEVMQGLLNMRVPSRNRNYLALRRVFVHEVFTEQVLATQAARVPVTKNLNNNTYGQHPVHCVLQLLKSRAFAKNRVPIKDWIYQQLCNCTAPVHNLLPELIEQYVQTVVQPDDSGRLEAVGLMNKPLNEVDVLAQFSAKRTGVAALCSPLSPHDGEEMTSVTDQERDLTPQLLILYYVLCLKDVSVQQRVEIIKAKRQAQLSSSTKLMSKIPIKYLLHYARRRQGDYRSLYPSLIKLVTKYYPQLVSMEYEIEDLMMLDREWTIGQPESLRQRINSPEDLKKALARVDTNPESALMFLQHLKAQPLTAIVPFHGPIVESLPVLLRLGRPRRVLTAARDLWLRLNMIMPRKLMILTVDALRSKEDRDSGRDIFKSKKIEDTLDEEDILKDPVETFLVRLDPKVFRCSPILEVVLRMLEFALAAGRSMWDHLLWENPGDGIIAPEKLLAKDDEKNNLKQSMLLTQESAVVQLLLERCLPTDDERKQIEAEATDDQCPVELREVQAIMCTFIHHMFIANQELIKLVMWQTYDLEQLPMTIEGIPSIHIGTNCIISLFCGAAEPKRLIFFFNWMSHVALQYRIQANMDICSTLIQALSQICLTVIPRESKPQFCLPCLEGMVRISKAYPKLAHQATRFLLSLASHCRTELGCLSQPIPPQFMPDRLMEDEMKQMLQKTPQLSLVDKYRLCYVKTMNAFDEIISKTLVQRHVYHSAT